MPKDQLQFFGTDFPYITFEAITPSDTNTFTNAYRSIFVGVGGDVVLTDIEGNTVTFKNVPSGTILKVQPVEVHATGTTATDIVGLV